MRVVPEDRTWKDKNLTGSDTGIGNAFTCFIIICIGIAMAGCYQFHKIRISDAPFQNARYLKTHREIVFSGVALSDKNEFSSLNLPLLNIEIYFQRSQINYTTLNAENCSLWLETYLKCEKGSITVRSPEHYFAWKKYLKDKTGERGEDFVKKLRREPIPVPPPAY